MKSAQEFAAMSNMAMTAAERAGLIMGGIAQAAELGMWSAQFLREEFCPQDFADLPEQGFTIENTPEHTYVRWNNLTT